MNLSGISYLLLISLLWAFSFGLIKAELTGIDSTIVALLRLFIAWLAFLAFTKKIEDRKIILKLILIGMLQFGAMYILYIRAFQYLQAYEVALFTIFTPLYVTFFNDIIEKKINVRFLIAALLSVIALMILKWQTPHSEQFLIGFCLMQGSNISFAGGQIAYKTVMQNENERDYAMMPWLYLGGWVFALLLSFQNLGATISLISTRQGLLLIYLGAVASGIGFWGWNAGARKVNAGTLAVFNNLKIPLALIISIFFFGESVMGLRLMISLIVFFMAIFIVNTQKKDEEI